MIGNISPSLRIGLSFLKMAQDLNDRKISEIPMLNHYSMHFWQKNKSLDLKDNIKDVIGPEEVTGKYVGWYADEKPIKSKGRSAWIRKSVIQRD